MDIMNKILQIILYTILLSQIDVVYGSSGSGPDQHCLDCICQASTGCKKNIQCHNDGAGGYFCGPYQISWAYWSDGGKPGDQGFPNDFEKCLVQKQCSEMAVRGYMSKWGNDCNADGRIDCLDYAAIHKAGASGCQQHWLLESKYWNEFQKCYQQPPATNSQPRHSTSYSSSSSSSSHSSSSNSMIISSASFRDIPNINNNNNRNQPSSTIIEIPRPPKPFIQPPLLPPPPPPLPFAPPVVARASASVPGASASAAASAGFRPDSSPISFASARADTDDDDDGDGDDNDDDNDNDSGNFNPEFIMREFNSRRLPGRRPNNIASLSGPFNKPSPLLSNNFKPIKPTRFDFPGTQPSFPPLPQPPRRLPSPGVYNNNNNGNNNDDDSVDIVSHTITVPKPAPAPSFPSIPINNPETTVVVSSGPEIVPQDCLECLCHASTKCDLNKGCDGAYCGPYLLSWGYWADGGQPGNEYASCSKRKQCSEVAIQGYMDKWKKDCNRDGRIDCVDFALIHKLGPHGCGKIQALESTDYWSQFTECYATPTKPVRSLNPVIVETVPKPPVNTISNINDHSNYIGPLPPKPPSSSPLGPRTRSLINNNDDDDNDGVESFTLNQPGVIIRVNNRDIVNSNANNRLREIPQNRPVTRLDLSHLNQSRPIIIRIKPPNSGSSIVPTQPERPRPRPSIPLPLPPPPPPAPRPQPRPVRPAPRPVDDDVVILTRPVGPISNNNDDDFFSQPRPSEQPFEQPNVSEVRPSRPQPPPPPPSANRPRPPPISRQNSTRSTGVIGIECLECICYASSKCSSSIGCRSQSSGKYICGPYQVDWEYWADAGKPGNRADLSNLENFQMCLNDRDCADQTVQGYMAKWRKDCNEDGTIDCNDYASIHMAGPNGCNAQWYLDSKYYSDFRECYDF